ncbi:Ethylene-responsive transcription factor WRI1 [Acorus calamus]|uniref:Ethylene-responsive transcription factor WRI1 n=1 Tax=Acorus calamus TaxID=4465 RepID=A0AAV9DEY9_ACOCL|nr:Ethylene-responsive transcription factor WRI1 [Acorus calamus]
MDVVLVKNETNVCTPRRRISDETVIIDGEKPKCIKRRRREPPLPPLIIVEDNKDPSDPSPTSTGVKRSSRFRGVSRHRWTGRYEAHLWDKGSWNATQKKKGKQGAYNHEESAARAYDLAALKYWGPTTFTNFPVTDYEKELEIMQNVSKEEYLASLRRKSSGFSRGVSKYRGVARHHHNGRWEARIGRVFGNKYLYLGTYSTQEEAAHAYDIAAIEYRGINAVTNFDLSTYIRWLRPGASNNNIFNSATDEQRPTHLGEPYAISAMNLHQNSGHEPFVHRNQHKPFTSDDIDSPCIPHQASTGCFQFKSAPTALGLLFRSSMFRELLERNSNTQAEDIEGEDTKVEPGVDEFSGIFYDGMGDLPYICGSNGGEAVTNNRLLDESSTYLDQQTGYSPWRAL